MKSILSYKVRPYNREEIIMQKTMTYSEWTYLFKRSLKRAIRQKAIQALQLFILTVLILTPVWMFLDWLLRGY
jgi:hypothetical protein